MKKKSSSQSAFFNFRVLFLLCSLGALLVFAAFGALPGGSAMPQRSAQDQTGGLAQAPQPSNNNASPPVSGTTATAKDDRRASAIPATKLSGPHAAEVFNLATTRAESVSQAEVPNEATLTTDQEDYQPYTYVYITGTGFAPGETVNMIVVQLSPEAWQNAWAAVGGTDQISGER